MFEVGVFTDSLEEKFKLITENVNELISIVNKDYIIEFINIVPHLNVLGYNEEDLKGKSWLKLVHPKDLKKVKNNLKLDSEHMHLIREIRLIDKKGNFKKFKFDVRAFVDNSNTNKFIIILSNITKLIDKRETEQQLKESEEKFRTITEQSLMGIIILQNSKIQYINKTAAHMVDYTPNEILNFPSRGFINLVYPADRKMVIKQAKKRQRGIKTKITGYECRCLKKNGDLIWLQIYSKTITYHGKFADLITVIDITDKKKAEIKSKESEQTLRYLLSSNPIVIYTSRITEGRVFTFVSENVRDMTGYSPEDFIKKSHFWNLKIHPEDKDRIQSQLRNLSKKDNLGLEYRFRFKDGIYHWIQDEFKIVKDKKGLLLETIGSWLDVTVNKNIEEKVKFQAKLVETISDAIISTDLKFNIITWNKAAESIYGWKAEEVKRKNISDVIPIEYPYDYQDIVLKEFFEIGKWKGEVIQPRKNGNLINILTSISMIKGNNGKPIGVVAINRDITERKKAEEKIRESERRLIDLLETVPVGISITNLEGKVIECNSNMFKIFGYDSKDEFLKTLASDHYYDPNDRERFIELTKKGIVKDFAVEFKRKDGSVFWGSLTSSTQKDVGQTVFITSLQDITDRKLTEIKIQQSEVELSAIYNYAPIAILLVDHERRIRKINKFALKFTDRHEEEVLGIHGGEALRCLYSIIDPKGCGFSEYCQDCTIRNSVLDTLKTRTPYINVEATLYLLPGGDTNKIHLLISTVPLKFDGEDLVLISLIDITERKKAEERVQYQAKLVDDVSDAIISTDLEFNIISWNKAAESIYGWKAEEVIGKGLRNNIPIEYPYDEEKVVLKKFFEKGFWKGEIMQKHKNGAPVNILSSVSVIKDINGNPNGAVAINKDISERKKADRSLKESEKRYKHLANELEMILDHLPGIIVYKDTENNILRVNKFMADAHNLKKEDMEGKSSFNFYPNEEAQAYWEDDLEVVGSKKPKFNIIEPWETLKGRRWVNTSKIPYIDEDNNVKGIIAMAIDITDRLKAEQKLKESEARFKYLVSSNPAIIYTSKTSGDFGATFISKNVKQLAGYTPEQFVTDSNFWIDHIHPNDKEYVLTSLSNLYERGYHAHEYRFKFKDNTYHWMRDELKLIIDESGNYSEIIGFWIDITEKKIAEEKLKESEERYRSFIENFQGIAFQGYKDFSAAFFHGSVEEITGYQEDDFVSGRIKWNQILHPDDLPEINEKIEKFHESALETDKREYRIIHKNGDIRSLIEYNQKFFDPIINKEGVRGVIINNTKFKEAERLLIESEEKYRKLFNNAPFAIVLFNTEGHFFDCNEATFQITGYHKEELLGRNFTEFEFYPDLKVARLEKRETLIKHGAIPPPREILLNKKDKTQFWARTYLDFIHIGNKNYIQAIIQDVTQQKIAEDKLKDSEERFKYLVSSSPTIIYTAKASGDYGATFISNNVEEKWGYDPDIFVHDSEFWLNHVHPDDKEHVLTMLSDISEKNYIIYEYRFKLNDGNYHWMRDEVMLVRDDSGNPVETIGSVIDITERVEAELELKNSEEKFRTIAEQSTLGVMIQQDGLIKFVNKAFSEILEYPLEEISNWTEKDTFKVIHEEDVHIVKEKSRTRKEGDYDKTISYECRIITKSGQAKWVEVMSKPIKYFGRYAILISTIDTTARKKVEEELMEVSRLKSELLSRTSHELKTPLVSIKGYADLLLSQHYEELDFYTISVLHEMKQGCNRLESLIKDLIETSKLETGEVDLNKTKDDLTFLIKFCVRDLKGLIETRNHTLVMDIQDSMITLIEKERIYEVVINLLSNAIKYTPPNGRIIIKSESKDNTYIVSIKDNGIGLTNEEKEKIFKKFGKIERYGKGLDVVSEGSGLGLYISKKIIELHGGDIWVESKGRDKGSKFSFSIPILKE